jgi:hypothetical protein
MSDALVAGVESNENMYVGRVEYMGSMTPAKVVISHKKCYVPYDGKTIALLECEVKSNFA